MEFRRVLFRSAPKDVDNVKGVLLDSGEPAERKTSDDAPFSALAFKIMNDPFVGSLTFARVYSGTLQSGSSALNSVKGQKERVGRMLLMHAKDRKSVV